MLIHDSIDALPLGYVTRVLSGPHAYEECRRVDSAHKATVLPLRYFLRTGTRMANTQATPTTESPHDCSHDYYKLPPTTRQFRGIVFNTPR